MPKKPQYTGHKTSGKNYPVSNYCKSRNTTRSTKWNKLSIAPGSSPVYRDRYDEIDWSN